MKKYLLITLLVLVGCSGESATTTGGQCVGQIPHSEYLHADDLVHHSDGHALSQSIGGIYTASWPRLPIAINVDTPEIRQAAAYWIPSGVRFTFGQRGGIEYVGDLNNGYCGMAYVYDRGTKIYRAQIFTNQNLINRGVCGSKVQVLAHEIGHAIGIIGHTRDGGLMDATGGNRIITVSVRKAIQALYNACEITTAQTKPKPKPVITRVDR